MEIKGNTALIAKTEAIDLEALAASMVDVIELELIRPITVGGDQRERLTFEEPTGRHVELMSKAGSAKAASEMSFRVLGECVGLSPDEVKELRSRDLVRLGEVLRYFLPGSQPGVI